MFKMNIVVNTNNRGKARILYENDSIIWKLIINLKALVIPHAGQGIVNIFLNMQGILNLR